MTARQDAQNAVTVARVLVKTLTRDRLGLTILDRIRDADGAHPGAQAYNGSRPGGSGISDPTGSAAAAGDRARHDLRTFEANLRTVARLLDECATIAATYQPRPPSSSERSETHRANMPHCESCARVEIVPGRPWLQEPRSDERSTVADRLPAPKWLCRWCYRHVYERGCLPDLDELAYRRDHGDSRRVHCPHPVKPIPNPESETP